MEITKFPTIAQNTHGQSNPTETNYLFVFSWALAGSWLLCGLIGSLSLVFSDADHVTGDYDDGGVAPSCVITSGYYHGNYVLTVSGCILLIGSGIWFFQVCIRVFTQSLYNTRMPTLDGPLERNLTNAVYNLGM